MKKRLILKGALFIQTLHPYPDDLIVVVGVETVEEIERLLKKKYTGLKPWFYELLKAESDCFKKETAGKSPGFTLKMEIGTILWFKEFSFSWKDFGTLIHEIYHVIDFTLEEERGMQDEMEAKAYMMEWLFESLRINLWNRAKKGAYADGVKKNH